MRRGWPLGSFAAFDPHTCPGWRQGLQEGVPSGWAVGPIHRQVGQARSLDLRRPPMLSCPADRHPPLRLWGELTGRHAQPTPCRLPVPPPPPFTAPRARSAALPDGVRAGGSAVHGCVQADVVAHHGRRAVPVALQGEAEDPFWRNVGLSLTCRKSLSS